ncbi:MAG: tetratricopeptide repeat protein [Bryobacteraceae bacterium]
MKNLALLLGISMIANGQVELDSWAIDHFQQALEAQKARRYDTAIEQYRLVLSKNPKFAEGYLNLGIVYQLQTKYTDSIGAFHRCLSIKPEMAAADVLLGISYYMVQEFQASRKQLERALSRDPKERQAGIYRALALMGLDQPEEAARQLRQTARYYPDDMEVAYHLGTAYSEGVKKDAQHLFDTSRGSALYEWAMAISAEHKNDTNSALLHYLKAMQSDPNIPQLYVRAAALFEKAGCPELARDVLQRLSTGSAPLDRPAAATLENSAAEKKDLVVLWSQLAHVHPEREMPRVADTPINTLVREQMPADKTGVLRAALADYEQGKFAAARARLMRPPSTGARHWVFSYLLARSYMGEGNYEAAGELVERALARHSDTPSVAFLKVEIQSELALRCYELVLSKRPESSTAMLLRAKSLAAANENDKAIEEFKELLRISPEMPQVHLGIAQIYADNFNWPGVIEELVKEVEISPDNFLALALLGHAYSEAALADQALPILTKVLAKYPRDASALADLGKVLAQKKDTPKAIEALERALSCDPGRYRIHYRLFQLYQSMGQVEPAGKHLSIFRTESAKHGAAGAVVQ